MKIKLAVHNVSLAGNPYDVREIRFSILDSAAADIPDIMRRGKVLITLGDAHVVSAYITKIDTCGTLHGMTRCDVVARVAGAIGSCAVGYLDRCSDLFITISTPDEPDSPFGAQFVLTPKPVPVANCVANYQAGQGATMKNRFYVAANRVTQPGDTWAKPTLTEAIAHAREILDREPMKGEIYIAQLIRVVRREKAPVTVEVIGEDVVKGAAKDAAKPKRRYRRRATKQ